MAMEYIQDNDWYGKIRRNGSGKNGTFRDSCRRHGKGEEILWGSI